MSKNLAVSLAVLSLTAAAYGFHLAGFDAFISYLLCINLAGAILIVSDKAAAHVQGHRIPERILFATALLGATPSMLVAMTIVRHKTQKLDFQFKLLLVVLLQGLLLILFRGNFL